MADTTALKNRIRAAIKANDNQEITGPVLQQALLDMVDELDLNPELENEAQQRQNGDTQLNNLITGIKNNVDTISNSVAAIVRSCSYRGKITVEGKTVKFGVGEMYLSTTKGNYTIGIPEEKVFENIAQNNMFIVIDTANNNKITTRDVSYNSDNQFNRITDIPLLYWDSNVVYGYLANYLVSNSVNAVSNSVAAVSNSVAVVSKNVDTIVLINDTITVEKGKTKTIAYKSEIPNRYIKDNILYVTVVTDTKDINAKFTLYTEDETMTRQYSISLVKTNTIALPLEGKYNKYSIYISTDSEEQIVASIKILLGRDAYTIYSLDNKTNRVDTIVRSCSYRGNITVEGKTVKFSVGEIYLCTTEGDYTIGIPEEKVFENIAQDNKFIVVDTANNNEITTRDMSYNSANRFNRITDIPLLYWESDAMYGYLANSIISKNVNAVSKNVAAVSNSVAAIVRSCSYRGKITVEGKTVKFGVGEMYLSTTKGNYTIGIPEEKVFENIAQNNMFIVIDTANNNKITTRDVSYNSDNQFNRITDIPLLYWDSNVVYGYLANYLVSNSVNAVSNSVAAVSKNVDTLFESVDTTVLINDTITVEKGKITTIAYKSKIPSSYIKNNILYVTVVTDTKDIAARFTLYTEDETMTRQYYISLVETNTIALPLEGKYNKYSIYLSTGSEEQIVTRIKIILGRYEYIISSLDGKTDRVSNVIENNFVSLPSNIKEEIGLTFKRFSSWNVGKDKIVFPVFTDIHAGYDFNKIKQLKNLIDNFNQFGFDFYANLGDVGIDVAYTKGGLDASYKLLNYISDVSNTANAPVLFANGNHETVVKEFPTRLRKEYLNKPQERKWKGLKYTDGGNNGIYFNEEKSLKVIILDNYAKADTDNNPSYLTYEGIDKEQLSWFIAELVKAKDVENIIVLEHSFPHYKGNWRIKKEDDGKTIYEDPAANDNICPSRASIRNTIIAFNKRQAGTDSIYNNVSYDFSNATGTICGLFSGHSHFDVHHQEDGLLLVCHQSMGDLNLKTEMPSWGIYSGFDKLTNTLIDVVSICPSTRQIKIFRVGAGGEERDREFSY